MEDIAKEKPFKFATRLHLLELAGIRASTLSQLLQGIKKVPASSIYYHTHAFFQEYQYLSRQSRNDIAFWVSEVVGETRLGEQLSKIDIMQYSSIQELQEVIARTIEDYLKINKLAKFKFAHGNEAFHFIKSISFVLPTNFVAYNLKDMIEILKKITLNSVYFHVFEARLRLKKPTNDFSAWINEVIGDKELASNIALLNPYVSTLEDLRQNIIRLIEKRIS